MSVGINIEVLFIVRFLSKFDLTWILDVSGLFELVQALNSRILLHIPALAVITAKNEVVPPVYY